MRSGGINSLEECSGHVSNLSGLLEASESSGVVQHVLPAIVRRMLPLTVDWREFAAGWCASFVNICITFPMNKVMFRQVSHLLHPDLIINQKLDVFLHESRT
jgi:hypothetical protein